jgi:hypothetical protein
MNSTHGCCVDKVCNARTCMQLPATRTCADCAHFRRCKWLIGRKGDEPSCDWFPRRLAEKEASSC